MGSGRVANRGGHCAAWRSDVVGVDGLTGDVQMRGFVLDGSGHCVLHYVNLKLSGIV